MRRRRLSDPAADAPKPRAEFIHLQLNLPKRLAPILDREAERLSLTRPRWIIALAKSRLTGAPQFSREGELALIQVHSELRRISVELAMARERCDALGPTATGVDGARLEAVRAEIRAAMTAIGQAVAGNLNYWRGEP